MLDQQIEEAYAQVSQLDEEINDLQSQISNREGSIEKKYGAFKGENPGHLYGGETSTLDIIFRRDSFNDFLDKTSLFENHIRSRYQADRNPSGGDL